MEKNNILDYIKNRIINYFDEFIIDEIQDIAGRDFAFLEKLMMTEINMLFVGDFFQHTYDTSKDGNTNKNLFEDKKIYQKRFEKNGFICDNTTLLNSWRCSKAVCDFVTNNLGITISSNLKNTNQNFIKYITDSNEKNNILLNDNIVKLHYQNSSKYGKGHKNWGDTKGEDCYDDVCVLLNKNTFDKYIKNELISLPMQTRNKLYVALTRAHRNVYLIKD